VGAIKGPVLRSARYVVPGSSSLHPSCNRDPGRLERALAVILGNLKGGP